MCLINNYKFIARNVSAIFITLLTIYGKEYSCDELIFMSCVIDAEHYIKKGTISLYNIASAFPEAMSGVCGESPFYHRSHETNLSSPATRLVCAIMQLEYLMFLVDTKVEHCDIVNSIIRHKPQIIETVKKVSLLKCSLKYYGAVEGWVRRCISESWFSDVIAYVEQGTLYIDDDNDAYPTTADDSNDSNSAVNYSTSVGVETSMSPGKKGAMGGWLLLLLIRIIGGAILAAYTAFRLWSWRDNLSGAGVAALVYMSIALFTMVLTIIHMLQCKKSFRVWFIISACLNVLYSLSLCSYADAASTFIMEGIWAVYLYRSKRVQVHCAC